MHLPLMLTCLDIYNKEELDLDTSRSEILFRERAGPGCIMEIDISVLWS